MAKLPQDLRIEETLPIHSSDYTTASRLAVAYILQVLKLQDFEMRIVGS